MEELKLILETTYEVRNERVDQFQESIFRDEYRKASDMVKEIIENNERLRERRDNDEKNDGQICNIIAFLGGRGSGKSSILTSYCAFLKGFQGYCANERSMGNCLDEELRLLLKKGEEEKISFGVLNVIDATMLESEESIVEIVLARMLEKVEHKERELGSSGRGQDETAKLGRKLQTDIGNIYRNMHHKEDKNDDEEAPVLKLKKLSKSWNLRKNFMKLVADFSRYLCLNGNRYGNGLDEDNYTVIPIDDIDMNVEKCWEMLEMIRKYLMVPKVILLLTFNCEQLDIVCRNHYIDKLYRKEDDTVTSRKKLEDITELAREYMEKVIPDGRKIYMPRLSSLGGSTRKRLTIGGLQSDGLDIDMETATLTIEKCIYAILRFYTGVVCLPDERTEYVYPHSMRRLNNLTKELLKLKRLESGAGKSFPMTEFNQNIDWLYQDVTNRFLQQYLVREERELLLQYLDDSERDENEILLKMLLEKVGGTNGRLKAMLMQIDRERQKRGYFCQGDYLLMLHIAAVNQFATDNAILCWHMLVSIKSTRMYYDSTFNTYKNTKSGINFLLDDLWGNWDEWHWYKSLRDQKPFSATAEPPAFYTMAIARVENSGEDDTKREKARRAFQTYFLTRIFLQPMRSQEGKREPFSVPEMYVLGLDAFKGWRFRLGGLISFVWRYDEYLALYEKELGDPFEQLGDSYEQVDDPFDGSDDSVKESNNIFGEFNYSFLDMLKKEKEKALADFRQEMDSWSRKYNVRELVPFGSTLFMNRVLGRFYDGQKKLVANVRAEVENLLAIMEQELERLDYMKLPKESGREEDEKTAVWNALLKKSKKSREDYPTISAGSEAFRECPVVKALRSHEDALQTSKGDAVDCENENDEKDGALNCIWQDGQVAEEIYENLKEILNYMSNRKRADEGAGNAEDTSG